MPSNSNPRNASSTTTWTSKRERLARILSDGRRHNVAVLANRLGSPVTSIRGRISELRSAGSVISHENGRVQLLA